MHRVLLVDDEKTTKDGIRFFIESNHFNLEVAGEAENGEEALEKIRELRPDIVLTDIKMPIMDGIELSGHIKKEYPDIKIIFISGYEDVNYLHSAFKVDAVDYILKPVKLSELKAVLNRATNDVDNEKQRKQYLYDMEKRIMQSMPLLRQRLFMLMINGREDNIDSIRQQMDFLNIRLPSEGRLCVICISMNNYKEMTKDMNLRERQCLTFAALNVLQEMIDKFLYGYAFENNIGELVGILSFEKEDYENDFLQFASEIKYNFKSILELDVTICLGEITNSLASLSVSYSGAKAAIENEMFLDENKTISMNTVSNTVYDSIIDEKTHEKITNLLRRSDENELSAIIREIFGNLIKEEGHNNYYNFNVCIHLMMYGMKFLNEIGVYSSSIELYGYQSLQKLTKSTDIGDMEEIILQYYSYICAQIKDKRIKKPNNAISAIKNVIKRRYAENLKIDDIAREVFLSATYICLIFKQETGMTINEYLTYVRIEKAKKLLENEDLKLGDVGMLVGYGNQSYFAKQFKQYVGCSPSEYGRKTDE